MTTESIVTSCVDEKKWVEFIRTYTSSEFKTDIKPAPCVFQVPKTITKTKPQAYAPQKVGLGPYHHLRPEFLAERHKLNIAKTCLNNHQVQHVEDIINKLCSIEPIFRPNIQAYYDKYLDLEDKTLVWILAIDSLYLLNLLSSYVPYNEIDNESRELAQDVIMLENQIPTELLIETRKTLNQSDDNLFTELFHNFCKAHSPLELTPLPLEPTGEYSSYNFCEGPPPLKLADCFKGPHLLAFLYNWIIKTWVITQGHTGGPDPGYTSALSQVQRQVFDAGTSFIPGWEIISFMILLWDCIKGLVKKEDEKKPLIEKIEIPSATELNEIAKINFGVTIGGGIRNIEFDERVFYLPEITLHSDSEVILRNLVAYEAAVGGQDGTLEFAEYVDLMCGIVDTPKDVDLLKKSHIIKGSLSDEEIADLFNGIPKTTGNYKEMKSELQVTIDSVNTKFHKTFRVKAHKFIKKHIHKHISWKFLSVLATVVLIILLSVQAFCQVYGCSSR